MAYEIRTADGALVTIQDGSANSNPQYTIDLVGRNTFNYGFYIAETQLHLLENFASTNKKPNFPTPGQLWYNKSDKSLYVNTGDNIHDYESWTKVVIGTSLGSPSVPLDSIIAGEFTGDNFNGGDFTGDNFNGGVFTGSFVGNLQGNAATASKWATPRQILLTGDVSGQVMIDGSANVSMATTVADDSHNHVISNVDGLQAALDSKSPTTHVHPGVINVPILLTATDHLDNIKTPGFYYQSTNANASTSRGYPEAQAGALTVTTAAGTIQQYHIYNSSEIYTRAQYSTGAWTTWAKEYNTLNKPTVGDVGAQPLDATLSAFANLGNSADKLPYFVGTDAMSTATFTSFARTLLDDADAATARGTIGAAPISHGHTIAEVSGLQGALDGKSPTSHSHTPASIGAAPASHTHPTSDVGVKTFWGSARNGVTLPIPSGFSASNTGFIVSGFYVEQDGNDWHEAEMQINPNTRVTRCHGDGDYNSPWMYYHVIAGPVISGPITLLASDTANPDDAKYAPPGQLYYICKEQTIQLATNYLPDADDIKSRYEVAILGPMCESINDAKYVNGRIELLTPRERNARDALRLFEKENTWAIWRINHWDILGNAEKSAEWREYYKALDNVTKLASWPNDVKWPKQPTD